MLMNFGFKNAGKELCLCVTGYDGVSDEMVIAEGIQKALGLKNGPTVTMRGTKDGKNLVGVAYMGETPSDAPTAFRVTHVKRGGKTVRASSYELRAEAMA